MAYAKPCDDPSVLARALHLGPRSGALLGLGFWLAAWAALGLHVAHAAGLGGGLVFGTVEVWLLTGACLGLPVMALRILGSHLTPHTCVLIGASLAACMVGLTILYATGSFTPRPLNAAVGLLLTGGMAMRCFNAADALRSLDAARRVHRTDCVMAEAMTEHEIAEAIAPLTPDQATRVLAAFTAAVQRCQSAPGLHAVNGGNRHYG
jgi:hypothetical protein